MDINKFIGISQDCNLALWGTLSKKYSKEMPRTEAKALAYVVVNYLLGNSLDKIISSAQKNVKEDVQRIRSKIEMKANDLMVEDKEEKELILRINAVNLSYFNSGLKEGIKDNIKNILNKYPNEYPDLKNPELLLLISKKYCKRVDNNIFVNFIHQLIRWR